MEEPKRICVCVLSDVEKLLIIDHATQTYTIAKKLSFISNKFEVGSSRLSESFFTMYIVCMKYVTSHTECSLGPLVLHVAIIQELHLRVVAIKC